MGGTKIIELIFLKNNIKLNIYFYLMNLKTLNEKSEYIICNDYDNTCSICLNKLNNTCRKLKCNHIFHVECIDNWLSDNVTCPMCRDKISDENVNINNNNFDSIINYNLYLNGINALSSCFLLYSIIRHDNYRLKMIGYWVGIISGLPIGFGGGLLMFAMPVFRPTINI